MARSIACDFLRFYVFCNIRVALLLLSRDSLRAATHELIPLLLFAVVTCPGNIMKEKKKEKGLGEKQKDDYMYE